MEPAVNFDVEFDLDNKSVTLVNKENSELELSGNVVEVHPASPGDLNEGWIIEVTNPVDQYQVQVTSNHWNVYVTD